MAFRKAGENERQSNTKPFLSGVRPPFGVSIHSYTRSKDIVSVGFLLLIPLPLLFKMHIIGEGEDVRAITAIVGGICAVCFSLPLLLKEVDFRSNFWQQFFIAGFLLFLATILGVLSILAFDDKKMPDVSICFVFLLIIIAPVSISYLANDRLKKKLPDNPSPKPKPVLNVVPSLGALFLSIIISLFIGKGNTLMVGFIVASLFSLFHVFIILLSIIIEFLFSPQAVDDDDLDLRKAIAAIVEENQETTTTEEQLMHRLIWDKFKANPERVSRTKVLEWVTIMDLEDGRGAPAVTIYNYDNLIPHWNVRYSRKLEEASPKLIIIDSYKDDASSVWKKINKDRLWNLLSHSTQLSVELIKHNVLLELKYSELIFYHLSYFSGNSVNIAILFDKEGERFLPGAQRIGSYSDLAKYYNELMSVVAHELRDVSDIQRWILDTLSFDPFFGSPPNLTEIEKEMESNLYTYKDRELLYKVFHRITGEYYNEKMLIHRYLFRHYEQAVGIIVPEVLAKWQSQIDEADPTTPEGQEKIRLNPLTRRPKWGDGV